MTPTMTHSGSVYDGQPAPRGDRIIVNKVVKHGVSFGSALAIAISWSLHKSIFWAVIHGIFSWLYVLYYAVTRS